MSENEPPRRTRAGRASAAFGRLNEATQTSPVVGGEPIQDGAVAPGRQAPAESAPAGTKPVRRFNARFYSEHDSDAIDRWTSHARKKLGGGKVDMARVLRELVREVASDPELSARIVARMRENERPATIETTFI